MVGYWWPGSLPNFWASSQRYRYLGDFISDCRLQINDVQHADAGYYFFSFYTTFEDQKSKTSTKLYVKELTAAVQSSSVAEGDDIRLTCVSGCPTPVDIPGERTLAGTTVLSGDKRVRSAPVAVNVLYPPDRVTLTISSPGNVVRGSSVVLTCHSDASPPVRNNGYSLYREGRFIGLGQNYTIPDVQPDHSGRYHCQAWNSISSRGVDHFNSSAVLLQVYYVPENISITINPAHVVWGSSVNLTCSSDANPPADTYIWYRNTNSSSSNRLQVGSGQVLSIPSMEALHSGLYLCQARNQVGGKNSTEVLLAMVDEEQRGSQTLPAVVGIGLALIVALVVALFVLVTGGKKGAFIRRRLMNPTSYTATSKGQTPLCQTSLAIRSLPPPPLSLRHP
ncbi:B-cell receptor CD22-like [Takifugu flavidus]|uniref:B-cell receptor CD22-like n=1 Tax=Takifugu flavidus TaxID=433684 RepID=UPI002544BF29|nr:B-cell receptor CD22-like [Takifugu flavidus]